MTWPRLDLPNDLQFLAQGVVFDRGQRYEVLGPLAETFSGRAGSVLFATSVTT